jgi:hypothetical protein
VELDPEHAAGRYFLAVGLLAAGNVPEAVEEMTRAKALGHSPAPEFLRALENATRELIKSNDPSTLTENGAEAPDNEKES